MSSDDEADRTTSTRIVWPKGTEHNGNNHEQFKTVAESFTRHFGGPGKSVDSGINLIPTENHKDDLIDEDDPNSDYKYDHLLIATYADGSKIQIVNISNSNFAIRNKHGATVNAKDLSGKDCVITVSEFLSQDGTKDYKYDKRLYEKYLEKYLRVSAKLITFLLTGINIEIQSALELIPAYKTALKNSLSFEFFAQIGLKYGHTTNGRMISHRTITGLQLKQTGTHEEFCHSIFKLEKTLNADLGGTLPVGATAGVNGYKGFIDIRKLCTIIYQMGLSQNDFAQRLEVFYSTNPTGIIAGTLEETMTQNSLYLNTKTAVINPSNEPTSSLYTSPTNNPNLPAWNKGPPRQPKAPTPPGQKLSTPTPTPTPSTTTKQVPPIFLNGGANTKCHTCGNPFPTTPRANAPGQYHGHCKSCYQKLFNLRAAAATKAANNTPPPAGFKPTTTTDPKSASAINQMLLAFLRQQDEDSPNLNLFTATTNKINCSDEHFVVHTPVLITTPDVDFDLSNLFNPTIDSHINLKTTVDSTSVFRILRVCSIHHLQTLRSLELTKAFDFYSSCHQLPHNIPTIDSIRFVRKEFHFHETTGHIQNKKLRRPSPTSHREQRNLHRSEKRTRTSFAQLPRRHKPSHFTPRSGYYMPPDVKARVDAWNASQTQLVRYVSPNNSYKDDDPFFDSYEALCYNRHSGHYANRDNPMPFKLFCDKHHKNLRRSKRISTRRTRNREPCPYSHCSQTSNTDNSTTTTDEFDLMPSIFPSFAFQSTSTTDEVSTPTNPFGYWDSGCTYSATSVFEIVTNPMPITRSIQPWHQ